MRAEVTTISECCVVKIQDKIKAEVVETATEALRTLSGHLGQTQMRDASRQCTIISSNTP